MYVLMILTLLIALIALILGLAAKQPQHYLLQLFPSRFPGTLAAGAALLMELGRPWSGGDEVKAHPDMVPAGAAWRFVSPPLKKPPYSSKQL